MYFGPRPVRKIKGGDWKHTLKAGLATDAALENTTRSSKENHMISSVGSMNSYMPTMRTNQAGHGPDGKNRFQSADTDSSGGISTSELESFASNMEETTGTTIDTDTAMESYDLDGDDQLSGEELFTLVSEYRLQPSQPGAGQGGGGPLDSWPLIFMGTWALGI